MSALTDLIYSGSNAVAGLTEGAVNDAMVRIRKYLLEIRHIFFRPSMQQPV